MSGLFKRAIADKAAGNRPSAPRALVVAAATGAVAAGLAYKVMRS
jgi:hypothetical protein